MSLTRDETRTVQFAQEAAARGLLEPGNPAHATYLLLNKLTSTQPTSDMVASGPVAAVPDKPKRGRKPRADKPATASNVSTPWGTAIGAILTKADISQAALGKACGVSGMAVSRWLNRGGKPGEDALAKLSDIAAQHGVALPIAEGTESDAPVEVGTVEPVTLDPAAVQAALDAMEGEPAAEVQAEPSATAEPVAEPPAASKGKRNRKGLGGERPAESGNGKTESELVNA